MANEYEYTVILYGDKGKLKWAESIIKKAVYDASTEMEDFLQEYGILVPEDYEDADCHHLSLLAMLFCKADGKETVANEAWRDFLSGCHLEEDGTLDLYCSIAVDVDAFFSSLVEHSDYLESYDVVCNEDEDYESEYAVTLYGNNEKLKWAASIVEKAILHRMEVMGDFLSSYGVTVPDSYQDKFCSSASLLGILLCTEDTKEWAADSLNNYAIKDCYLGTEGELCILFDNLDEYGDNDITADLNCLLEHSTYLKEWDVDTEFESIGIAHEVKAF